VHIRNLMARMLMLGVRRVQMIEQFAYPVVTLARNISDEVKNLPAPHILIVDDEQLVRWAMAETLQGQGYRVSVAGDAESAKQAILTAETAPDMAFLDLRLPDSDDLSLVLFIRAHAPTTSTVLMTAYGTPELLGRAAALGLTIVIKPFDLNELSSIVDRSLMRRG
jgi:two-component system OmpR family response regulator